MRYWNWIVPLCVLTLVGCEYRHDTSGLSATMTPERAAAVERDVRAYAATVAHDVTQQGPAAWRNHLSDSPSFFLASDGQLAFSNGAAAMAGIPNLEQMIKHIDLQWGPDVRVDPLTPQLAVLAAPWHEVRTMADGQVLDQRGYFTAIAEYTDGRWQLRNCHWSVLHPEAKSDVK